MATGTITHDLTVKMASFSDTVGNYGEIQCVNMSLNRSIVGIVLTKVGSNTDPTNILCVPRILSKRIRGFYLSNLVSQTKLDAGTVIEGNYFYIEH